MNRPLRVLHVEDSERDVALLTRHLSRAGYELVSERVDTPEAMRAALESRDWDITLCDYAMPHFSALSALALVKEMERDIPFIIISGTVGEDVAVDAMRAGANDYLMKDKLARLAPAIERELAEARNRRAHRQAEADLRQSEAQYRRLIDTTFEGVWIFDSRLRTTYVNQRLADMLGVRTEEMIGRSALDFVPEESHADLEQRLQLRTQGIKEQYDLRMRRKDGSDLWVIVCATPVLDEHGAFTGSLSMLTDITERKRVEEERARLNLELERQRQRLDNLVASVPGVVWEAWGEPDAGAQRIDFVSDYATQMLGYSVEEWLRTPNFWLTIVHPDDKEQAGRIAAENFARGASSGPQEFRWIAKDGHAVWVESNYVILKDDKGRPAGMRGVTTDVSERKFAEEKIRQSERQLAEAQRIAHIGSWNWDLQTDTLNWSDEHFRMFGLDPQEFRPGYEALLQLVHPDDRAICTAAVESALKTHEPLSYFVRIIRPGGEVRILHSRGNVICDARGKPMRMFGTAQDVTELKEAEEALRQSEERYRLLFASNPLPMWVYDIETLKFLTVNDAAIHHYGYSREEFLSMAIKDIRPSEDLPALLQNVGSIDKGIDKAGVWRHRRKNGEIIEVEITSHELTFAGRRSELVLANDVTERRRIEEIRSRRAARAALRADVSTALAERGIPLRRSLEECAEALVHHLGAAFARIWTLNQEENVLELQASAGTYTHVDGPHARVPVGMFKIGLIAKERQPHITNEVQTDPRVSDKEWAKREGMIAFAGYPLLVEDRLVGVIAMFSREKLADDTLDALASVADMIAQGIERKRVREALRRSEEQLRQSQKMEAVGQLAGGIAHDFNNLLTAITGYSDLTLRRLSAEDPLRKNVEEIKKAGDRAAGLTRQLLAFSRKQVLQPKVLDLNTVVTDLGKMLRRLIGENVELRTALDPQLGSVKADPGQVEQVIMNLVINARDAMPHGGRLTIETRNVHLDEEYARTHVAVTPGPYVMLAVSDTGTGMDAETQARIFEPFFTTKEAGKGTGLGLSTVYGIVKQSGGSVWVYSEVGRGTTFKIYLRRADGSAERYRRGSETEEASLGAETILLAEDEEIVRNLARQVLEMYGYQVLEAANGGAALLICERHPGPIHLLITDVIMPEMSGPELASRLSQLRPEMKVLYMSGYTDDAIIHHAILEEGANFIQKPFPTAALARKVREVLDAPNKGA